MHGCGYSLAAFLGDKWRSGFGARPPPLVLQQKSGNRTENRPVRLAAGASARARSRLCGRPGTTAAITCARVGVWRTERQLCCAADSPMT